MKRLKRKNGVTTAEMLIVVAIIMVLAGVAFIGIVNHLRNMTKLEYDGYAKEIFVAAQNHLTMAAHEGYLGLSEGNSFGNVETPGTVAADNSAGLSPTKEGVYYIVVKDGTVDGENGVGLLSLMLPSGALADGKALSGSYIIRYHKDSARILDVYFWEEDAGGWAGRYNHNYTANDYKGFLHETPNGLKNYSGSVIGYYGGATAGLTYKDDVLAPSIKVENGDVLRVIVTNPNGNNDNIILELEIKGKTSGAVKTFRLNPLDNTDTDSTRISGSAGSYAVILDDITNKDNKDNKDRHFANLGKDESSSANFIPGEDVIITAKAYSTASTDDVIHNVAYSGSQTTNSLFDSISASGTGGTYDTARISNIRHLENLDNTISNVCINGIANDNKLAIAKAEQITNLDFTDFKPNGSSTYTITKYNETTNIGAGKFLPMNPTYALSYDGEKYAISNIAVSFSETSGDAGLFGAPTGAVTVQNLQLIDFTVSGANAGALAGTLNGGSSVTNVVAYNSDGGTTRRITGTDSVGGLIGVNNGSVTACAAALIVGDSSATTAGGLIGTSGGSVTASYSGGHTSGGAYSTTNFNVTGSSAAGGLIGSMTGGSVNYCYSTCSASGGTAGGFVGSASGGSVSNSYCTGLVGGTNKGAFAGTIGNGTIGNDVSTESCQYFSIINDADVGAVKTGSSNGITAFDDDTDHYEDFLPAEDSKGNALPYDDTLTAYYKGKYNLKTVVNLGAEVPTGYASWSDLFVSTHYGDWPSPEIFFVNTPA